ncbi:MULTISPECIES: hypothetical protein [Stenotrophomonas]|uniref:hypothetical protein n=1 Tax=Stenotrophomonas TaxID=40323 RepID=UPI000A4A8A82|nr:MULTISPECIES: hypothetical protein [Stenotrophomonas]
MLVKVVSSLLLSGFVQPGLPDLAAPSPGGGCNEHADYHHDKVKPIAASSSATGKPAPARRTVPMQARVPDNAFPRWLLDCQQAGVNHAALGIQFSARPADEILQELTEYVLPLFPSHAAPTSTTPRW